MSEQLTAVNYDAATGEVTERPLTSDEVADRQALMAEQLQREAEAQAKTDARASALAKIAEATGLTEAEIAAL